MRAIRSDSKEDMVSDKYCSAWGDFLHLTLVVWGARELLDEFKNANALEGDQIKGKGVEEHKKWETPLVGLQKAN